MLFTISCFHHYTLFIMLTLAAFFIFRCRHIDRLPLLMPLLLPPLRRRFFFFFITPLSLRHFLR